MIDLIYWIYEKVYLDCVCVVPLMSQGGQDVWWWAGPGSQPVPLLGLQEIQRTPS